MIPLDFPLLTSIHSSNKIAINSRLGTCFPDSSANQRLILKEKLISRLMSGLLCGRASRLMSQKDIRRRARINYMFIIFASTDYSYTQIKRADQQLAWRRRRSNFRGKLTYISGAGFGVLALSGIWIVSFIRSLYLHKQDIS
jgi:hypothetical protein